MSKDVGSSEGLLVFGSKIIKKSKVKKRVFKTNEGEMTREALAVRLGLTVPGLNTRVRAYGETDPRVIHGPNYFKKTAANWGGYSDKSRSERLVRLEKMTMSDFLNV
jgi:hypothetical protein